MTYKRPIAGYPRCTGDRHEETHESLDELEIAREEAIVSVGLMQGQSVQPVRPHKPPPPLDPTDTRHSHEPYERS